MGSRGEFHSHSKQGYPVIYRGELAVILFREDCPEYPYVVAYGYSDERGDWSQGLYLDDLEDAISGACR